MLPDIGARVTQFCSFVYCRDKELIPCKKLNCIRCYMKTSIVGSAWLTKQGSFVWSLFRFLPPTPLPLVSIIHCFQVHHQWLNRSTFLSVNCPWVIPILDHMITLLLLVTAFSCVDRALSGLPWPSEIVPGPFGVNIHFTSPASFAILWSDRSTAEKWRNGHAIWCRMEIRPHGYDLEQHREGKGHLWLVSVRHLGEQSATEEHECDFHLGLHVNHYPINCPIIFDRNSLYDNNLSPYDSVGREAFAKWATAAVQRYRGRRFM